MDCLACAKAAVQEEEERKVRIPAFQSNVVFLFSPHTTEFRKPIGGGGDCI